jgi:hypothetical protein
MSGLLAAALAASHLAVAAQVGDNNVCCCIGERCMAVL